MTSAVLLLIVEAVSLFVFGFFYNVHWWVKPLELVGVFVLATWGISIVGSVFERGPVLVARGQSQVAVSGHEDEGDFAFGEDVGDRKNLRPVEIDVEHGGVAIAVLGPGQGVLEATGLAGHAMAEVGEHFLQKHADKKLVLDDKNTCTSGQLSRAPVRHRQVFLSAP